jgi:phosphoglycerate kinase
MIKTLNQLNLKYKKILIRIDFNVPIQNGIVQDPFRILSSVPTIKFCLKQGASIILCSHLGRPNGRVVADLSLVPVGEILADYLECPIKFSHNCISEDAQDVSLGLKPGEVHLLENLRFHSGETNNDPAFSLKLAKHGDVYVNDAFGTAHRKHASNFGVVPFFNQKGTGLLIEKELKYLDQVIKKPTRPFVVILGGAKVRGKLELINRFLTKADAILIGGGMAFTFLKARGNHIGNSLIDKSMISSAMNILSDARSRSVQLKLPEDVIVAEDLNSNESIEAVSVGNIPLSMSGFDIGPKTILGFSDIISNAKTVLWNGPMGVFEQKEFEHGTRQIADVCANANDDGKTIIIGGGDTASAVNLFGLDVKMSHVSTGGGSSLTLLGGNRLPAIDILDKS